MSVPGGEADLEARRKALLGRLLAGEVRLTSSAPATIARLAHDAPLPMSSAQQRLVFVEALYPGNAFNGSLTLEHVGPLDAGRLRRALTAVAQRHDVLRTNVVMSPGGVSGRRSAEAEPAMRLVDLTGLDVEAQRAAAIQAGNQAVAAPIDIFSASPLFNLTLIRLAAEHHVLVLAMHMVAFDAPSGAIFAAEMAAAYDRLGAGLEPFAQPLAYQYADYVAAQARRHTDDEASRRHWLDQFAAEDEPLILPTDRARRPDGGFEVLRRPFHIASALGDSLKVLGRRHGVSFYTVLLAGLQVLLARHSPQDTVSVGAWTVRRNPANAQLIGPFVNPVVYRNPIMADDSFGDLLRRLKPIAAGMQAHADLPFEETVRAICPRRDRALNPLFQVHFILQEARADAAGAFALSELDAHIGAVGGYDIELIVRDLKRGLEGHFEFSRALFDPEVAETLTTRFLRVLEAVAADPEKRLDQIAFADDAWTPPAPVPGPAPDLAAQIGAIDTVASERVAGVADGRTITFGEFRAMTARIEQWIEAHLAPDAVVAVVGGPSLAGAAAMVAALRRGRPFAPFARAQADEALARLASLGGVGVLWDETEEASSTAAPGLGIAEARLSDVLQIPLSGPLPPRTPQDLAYVIATSGTTGPPRLAATSRRGLAEMLEAIGPAYGLRADDRVLQLADAGFDVRIEEALPTLVAGGRLVFPDWRASGLGALSACIARDGVTVLNMTASLWAAWAEHLRQAGEAPPDALRLIVIGSEPLDIAEVRAWRRDFGSRVELQHAYGATETGVTCCLYTVPTDTLALEELPRLPIGRPIGRFEVEVVDAAGRALPRGLVGELRVRGPAVAKGYLGEGADDRFASGAFATGDLARWRWDGNLEFLGRRSTSVKRRGQVVDLAAVRAAILARPEVQACRLRKRGEGLGARLSLRVWPAHGAATSVEADELRRGILAAVAEASGGLVDEIEIVGAPEAPSPPPTGVLAEVLSVWRSVATRELDPDASVFEQGVVSLDCLRFASLAERLQVPLQVPDVYATQTPRQQAALVDARRTASPKSIRGK